MTVMLVLWIAAGPPSMEAWVPVNDPLDDIQQSTAPLANPRELGSISVVLQPQRMPLRSSDHLLTHRADVGCDGRLLVRTGGW
jgi:hypothetical protein